MNTTSYFILCLLSCIGFTTGDTCHDIYTESTYEKTIEMFDKVANRADELNVSTFGLEDALGPPLWHAIRHAISNMTQTMFANTVKKAAQKIWEAFQSKTTPKEVVETIKKTVKDALPLVAPAVGSYITAGVIYYALEINAEYLAEQHASVRFALYQAIGLVRMPIGMFPFTTTIIGGGVGVVEKSTDDLAGKYNSLVFGATMPVTVTMGPFILRQLAPETAKNLAEYIMKNPMVQALLKMCQIAFPEGIEVADKTQLMEYVALGHMMPMFGTIMAMLHFQLYPNLWNQIVFAPLGAIEDGASALMTDCHKDPQRFWSAASNVSLFLNIMVAVLERNPQAFIALTAAIVVMFNIDPESITFNDYILLFAAPHLANAATEGAFATIKYLKRPRNDELTTPLVISLRK